MSGYHGTDTIAAAVHSARAVIDAAQASAGGVVIVLLREGRSVAVLWQAGGELEFSAITAAARQASTAVVIVVGTPRALGPILTHLDALQAQLSAAGITDLMAVHISSLDDGAAVVGLTHARDRLMPPARRTTPRRWGRLTAILGARRNASQSRRA
ncbi:hypothetical protein IU459_33740 [Nocardia amamiensis]|uniref:CdaR GGDEF-like domain-containing protein n=1 Tax=Nocardia amamiensis TaxID=404578 RepID=A0ABS0D0T7_9NOCA|nr:hypothetical protein [Nocardia amamiensis]MBF6302467.1 hypothetical protein [Nocardia amamiensis]